MSAVYALVAVVFKTVFFRLPLGIWLAALFCGAWVAAERHYGADYPLLPGKASWPVEFVNPAYPDSPSRVPQLVQWLEQVGGWNLGFNEANLAFGQTGYGVLLGITFGLLIAWPCGAWKTLRNYSGFLMFPVRVLVLGIIYAAMYGAIGGWLAATWSNNLLTSGYLAVFGLVTPLIVPLPFAVLRPLFPSLAGRQADLVLNQARREATTSLASVAKYDASLGDVTKGQPQQEWTYYGTVCGVFIATLLAEKRGVSKWWRRSVERQVRKKLNKQFEKGEHGLTAVMKFSREQLDRSTKLTTEVIVGLWLAMQMKGDLNAQRDRDLAASLGAHMIQGMSSTWTATSNVGTVLTAMLLWTGAAALGFAAMEPQKVEQQLAQFGWDKAAEVAPADNAAAKAPQTQPNAPGADSVATPNEPLTPAIAPADVIPPAETGSETTAAAETPPAEPSPETGDTETALADPLAEPEVTATAEPAEASASKPALKAIAAGETELARVQKRPPGEMRQWSHAGGRTIQAVASWYFNGTVNLERADGKSADVPIAQLSQEDRQTIYQQFMVRDDANNILPGVLLVHKWTDASGTRQVEAALVSISDTSVELLRPDGKLVNMPLAQLSKADQTFAQEYGVTAQP